MRQSHFAARSSPGSWLLFFQYSTISNFQFSGPMNTPKANFPGRVAWQGLFAGMVPLLVLGHFGHHLLTALPLPGEYVHQAQAQRAGFPPVKSLCFGLLETIPLLFGISPA